jgi:Protein of unknown function (DUF2628)
MPVYTVHEPPLRKRQTDTDPMRLTFVRDGFHFWAFLLGPLWMLRHRMWLVLIAHLIVIGGLAFALTRLGAPPGAGLVVGVLIALLIGLEASTLRRWTLARRGWHGLGVVVADDVELAERRFFDAWTGALVAQEQASSVHAGAASYAAPAAPAHQVPPPSPPRTNPAQPEVIGSFPQPGTQP